MSAAAAAPEGKKKALHSDPDRPPIPLRVNPEGIPDDLKRLRRWVAWKYTWKPGKNGAAGKWDKPPFSVHTRRKANWQNPDSWATFAEAMAAYCDGGWDGIGFVQVGTDGFIGFDLDDAADPGTGEVASWANDLIELTGTYTEASPSQTGFRGFGRGRLPAGCPNKLGGGRIEVYDGDRYLTVTGHQFGDPRPIADAQAVADAIPVAAPKDPKRRGPNTGDDAAGRAPPPPAVDDDTVLLTRAFTAKNGGRLHKLFTEDGNAGYPSASEADAALVEGLAFWCGPDPERIDRLARLSKRVRPRWDEPRKGRTLLRLTIDEILSRNQNYRKPTRQVRLHVPRQPADDPAPAGHEGEATAGCDAAPPSDDPEPPADTPFEVPDDLLTDMGNAGRFLKDHGDGVRWCQPWGKWLVWDGCRWTADAGGRVTRMAKQTVRGMLHQARTEMDRLAALLEQEDSHVA